MPSTRREDNAAPDCGLVKLPLDVARTKLANMVKGAEMARAQYRH